ncbi:MAG: TIGR03915 family putative DNA repair protein [Treponema sp.]|nr:TIGR03915 family putative DNA repair protein [Treponema sp.]
MELFEEPPKNEPDAASLFSPDTADRAQREIHRVMGFLRFSPDSQGVYTAKCAPDYFILPALAEHFTLRFGEVPWAIIDEKRGLRLCRKDNGEIRLLPVPAEPEAGGQRLDSVADLWRLYHRSVSIETRKNVRLQRQFMPERYRKYLNELEN